MKEMLKKFGLWLIVIQGKAKKCIYNSGKRPKFQRFAEYKLNIHAKAGKA